MFCRETDAGSPVARAKKRSLYAFLAFPIRQSAVRLTLGGAAPWNTQTRVHSRLTQEPSPPRPRLGPGSCPPLALCSLWARSLCLHTRVLIRPQPVARAHSAKSIGWLSPG